MPEEAPVIEVKNLVKEYRLGALEGLRSMAKRVLGRRGEEPRKQFRALDDVSFSVKRGEVVGIIGHNGAGKSTLLKHLCNITTPTSGSVKVRGRIAPLIEVGAGLIGEMTGRENIYLNASILGLSRTEIEGKVDEIIAFAELERFIDTPIKRYSSGMQVRLGYAIATAVDAEILIVDEVLAVGDLQFQRKSIERMQKLIQLSNRTVLIVGHNVRQLERVCTRIVMLDHGRVIADGRPAEVINLYYDTIQRKEIDSRATAPGESSAKGWMVETSGEVEVANVVLRSARSGLVTTRFSFGEPIDVLLTVRARQRIERADLGVAIQTLDHLPVAISDLTSAAASEMALDVDFQSIRCRMHSPNLMPGVFSLRIGIKDSWGQLVWGGSNICPFEVVVDAGENRARYSDFAFIKFGATWEVV